MTKSTDVPLGSSTLTAGVHEAKTRLSELLRLVESGQEVEIARSGVPIAKLVPTQARRTRQLGTDRGVFTVPDDFDAPLPDEIVGLFAS